MESFLSIQQVENNIKIKSENLFSWYKRFKNKVQ